MAGGISSLCGNCVYARGSYPVLPVLSAAATRQVTYLMSLALYTLCCLSCQRLPLVRGREEDGHGRREEITGPTGIGKRRAMLELLKVYLSSC